jgi:hypothetical protein
MVEIRVMRQLKIGTGAVQLPSGQCRPFPALVPAFDVRIQGHLPPVHACPPGKAAGAGRIRR